MKIRNGFVSNSSSSCFMIIGQMQYFRDIRPKDILNHKQILCIGKNIGGDQGSDIFNLTLWVYDQLVKTKDPTFRMPYVIGQMKCFLDPYYVEADCYQDLQFDYQKIPKSKKLKTWIGRRQYTSSFDVETIKQLYVDCNLRGSDWE